MVGEVNCGGIGTPVPRECVDVARLIACRGEHNAALLRSMRETPHSEWLLQDSKAEAGKGRMRPVSRVDQHVTAEKLLSPCFVVEQQKEDGSKKLRGIHHLSWGVGGREDSMNGATVLTEKLSHHTLDKLGK
eukprot:9155135-Karenia_brevis.AAC.1